MLKAFNSNLLVENYPLRERAQEDLSILERFKKIRRIELMAQKTRRELTNEQMKKDNITELVILSKILHLNINKLNN